jgi:hypothetical protein
MDFVPLRAEDGKKVYLKTREGLYVFEKFTFWNRLKRWIKNQTKND